MSTLPQVGTGRVSTATSFGYRDDVSIGDVSDGSFSTPRKDRRARRTRQHKDSKALKSPPNVSRDVSVRQHMPPEVPRPTLLSPENTSALYSNSHDARSQLSSRGSSRSSSSRCSQHIDTSYLSPARTSSKVKHKTSRSAHLQRYPVISRSPYAIHDPRRRSSTSRASNAEERWTNAHAEARLTGHQITSPYAVSPKPHSKQSRGRRSSKSGRSTGRRSVSRSRSAQSRRSAVTPTQTPSVGELTPCIQCTLPQSAYTSAEVPKGGLFSVISEPANGVGAPFSGEVAEVSGIASHIKTPVRAGGTNSPMTPKNQLGTATSTPAVPTSFTRSRTAMSTLEHNNLHSEQISVALPSSTKRTLSFSPTPPGSSSIVPSMPMPSTSTDFHVEQSRIHSTRSSAAHPSSRSHASTSGFKRSSYVSSLTPAPRRNVNAAKHRLVSTPSASELRTRKNINTGWVETNSNRLSTFRGGSDGARSADIKTKQHTKNRKENTKPSNSQKQYTNQSPNKPRITNSNRQISLPSALSSSSMHSFGSDIGPDGQPLTSRRINSFHSYEQNDNGHPPRSLHRLTLSSKYKQSYDEISEGGSVFASELSPQMASTIRSESPQTQTTACANESTGGASRVFSPASFSTNTHVASVSAKPKKSRRSFTSHKHDSKPNNRQSPLSQQKKDVGQQQHTNQHYTNQHTNRNVGNTINNSCSTADVSNTVTAVTSTDQLYIRSVDNSQADNTTTSTSSTSNDIPLNLSSKDIPSNTTSKNDLVTTTTEPEVSISRSVPYAGTDVLHTQTNTNPDLRSPNLIIQGTSSTSIQQTSDTSPTEILSDALYRQDSDKTVNTLAMSTIHEDALNDMDSHDFDQTGTFSATAFTEMLKSGKLSNSHRQLKLQEQLRQNSGEISLRRRFTSTSVSSDDSQLLEQSLLSASILSADDSNARGGRAPCIDLDGIGFLDPSDRISDTEQQRPPIQLEEEHEAHLSDSTQKTKLLLDSTTENHSNNDNTNVSLTQTYHIATRSSNLSETTSADVLEESKTRVLPSGIATNIIMSNLSDGSYTDGVSSSVDEHETSFASYKSHRPAALVVDEAGTHSIRSDTSNEGEEIDKNFFRPDSGNTSTPTPSTVGMIQNAFQDNRQVLNDVISGSVSEEEGSCARPQIHADGNDSTQVPAQTNDVNSQHVSQHQMISNKNKFLADPSKISVAQENDYDDVDDDAYSWDGQDWVPRAEIVVQQQQIREMSLSGHHSIISAEDSFKISANGTIRLRGFGKIRQGGLSLAEAAIEALGAEATPAAARRTSQQHSYKTQTKDIQSTMTVPNNGMDTKISPQLQTGTSNVNKSIVQQQLDVMSSEQPNDFDDNCGMTAQQARAVARAAQYHRRDANIQRELLILDSVGRGASASVRRALHIPTMQLVAVKQVRIYDAEKRAQMARELKTLYANMVPLQATHKKLAQEAQDAERAPAPYIVKFYDAFSLPTSGQVAIVMEYMNGGSWQDIVDQGGCQDEARLSVMASHILQGLAYLHQHRQLHRDIKPANLLCSRDGWTHKLADFGIAKQLGDAEDQAKTWIGTMLYMAPERIESNSSYGFPADVWALGLSLLTVAIGRFPYDSTSFWDVSQAIKEADAPLYTLDEPIGPFPQSTMDQETIGPSENASNVATGGPTGTGRNHHFSDEFREFLNQCLIRDPAKRPTASQLLSHPFIRRTNGAQLLRNAKTSTLGSSLRLDCHGTKSTESKPNSSDTPMCLNNECPLWTFSSKRRDEDKKQLRLLAHSLLDQQWDQFVYFFRRRRRRRNMRRKDFYGLDEASFNHELTTRYIMAGSLSRQMTDNIKRYLSRSLTQSLMETTPITQEATRIPSDSMHRIPTGQTSESSLDEADATIAALSATQRREFSHLRKMALRANRKLFALRALTGDISENSSFSKSGGLATVLEDSEPSRVHSSASLPVNANMTAPINTRASNGLSTLIGTATTSHSSSITTPFILHPSRTVPSHYATVESESESSVTVNYSNTNQQTNPNPMESMPDQNSTRSIPNTLSEQQLELSSTWPNDDERAPPISELSYEELRLIPEDVETVASQLGLSQQFARTQFNYALKAKLAGYSAEAAFEKRAKQRKQERASKAKTSVAIQQETSQSSCLKSSPDSNVNSGVESAPQPVPSTNVIVPFSTAAQQATVVPSTDTEKSTQNSITTSTTQQQVDTTRNSTTVATTTDTDGPILNRSANFGEPSSSHNESNNFAIDSSGQIRVNLNLKGLGGRSFVVRQE